MLASSVFMYTGYKSVIFLIKKSILWESGVFYFTTLCVVRTGDGGVDARVLVQVRPWDGDGGLEVTAADVGQTWVFSSLMLF